MGKNTSESLLKISVMAMASSSGRTVVRTTASGSRVNSMDLVFTEMLRAKIEEANGKMGRELGG
jgi:hypothetical protein